MRARVLRGLALGLALVTLLSAMSPVMANAIEPPSLVVILQNAPADAAVELYKTQARTKHSLISGDRSFVIYSRDLSLMADAIPVVISGGGETFTLLMDRRLMLKRHNAVILVDFSNRSFIMGKGVARSVVLIALRVLVTLAVEGLIFYALGFREKRSWMAFLGVNLLTQAAVNLWVNFAVTGFESYYQYSFLFLEVMVFLVELVLLPPMLREQKGRRGIFVVLANILSAAAGVLLITHLPV